jgi:NitT/TauT family transport system ATP-binding protein
MSALAQESAFTATEVAVEVKGAAKVYANGLRALQAIDLQVHEGEFCTLIGPSGCGKSTLLRMVAGLTEPSTGTVRLANSGSVQLRLAFVFQHPTLMPWASLEHNVRLPLDLSGANAALASDRVHKALELVGLRQFSKLYPRELSGGMQMRASIARALVTDPSLLLMDEPFGALDEITRARLDLDIRELWSRRRLTILFVTHSIYEAVFLSTRVLVMSSRPGRIGGQVHIDEPAPRTDAFRLSEKFMAWCKQLSDMLAAASVDEPLRLPGSP